MIEISADESTPRVLREDFPYFRIDYPKLNPIQSAIVPYVDMDVNIVVDSPTASGKTTVAEMVTAVVLGQGKVAMYSSPLKALTEEKATSWQSGKHPFADKDIVTLTSDYTSNAGMTARLARADIVLCTAEMVDARSRLKNWEDTAPYLVKTGLLVVDEVHTLDAERRGDRLESGLMSLTETNPDIRLVFLSATIRNAVDLARWATKLNGKDTVLLRSKWRPSKLSVDYPLYFPFGSDWKTRRTSRIERAIDILRENMGDNTILFVHSKAEGRAVVDEIESAFGIRARFHNADLSKDERRNIETQFLSGKLKFLVATSTLAYGLNLPAKRVIVMGVERGRQDVSPLDVMQEVGRAGRPQYDDEGFAHILLREEQLEKWQDLMSQLPLVRSQMAGAERLRFHVVSLVDRKRAVNPTELMEWHDRSLLDLQGYSITKGEAAGVFQLLTKIGVLKKISEDEYVNTYIGEVAAKLYFDPLAVSDWSSNWKNLAAMNLLYSDAGVAWAVARSQNFERAYAGDERAKLAVGTVADEVYEVGLSPGQHNVTIAAVYWYIRGTPVPELNPFLYRVRSDVWRMVSAWKWLAQRGGYDVDASYLEAVGVRLSAGAGWEVADLCRIEGVGPVTASLLVENGVTNVKQFLGAGVRNKAKRRKAIEALGKKAYFRLAVKALDMKKEGRLSVE